MRKLIVLENGTLSMFYRLCQCCRGILAAILCVQSSRRSVFFCKADTFQKRRYLVARRSFDSEDSLNKILGNCYWRRKNFDLFQSARNARGRCRIGKLCHLHLNLSKNVAQIIRAHPYNCKIVFFVNNLP